MQQTPWDVLVIGGGAAGLSAALMLGRARRSVLVLDAGSPRNRFAAHMHGVLGHEGRDPADLLAAGRKEVARYAVEVADAVVTSVEDVADGLAVTTTDGAVRTARAVVVATGITDRLPDVDGLTERWGVGVLHCPYCHGWEVRDQRLGVLVTSPLTLHQPELIRQWSAHVTVFLTDPALVDDALHARLAARGIAVVHAAPVAVEGPGRTLTAVRTADGERHPVDALFVAGQAEPHDAFLAPLDLTRADGPWGHVVEVDAFGRTSHPRVWAAGNVVAPMANVPMSMGAASVVGGAVNGALATEDTDAALTRTTPRHVRAHAHEDPRSVGGLDHGSHDHGAPDPEADPLGFWEDLYTETDRRWSGAANATFAAVASTLTPGTALDLGCGEGGDVLWLAEHGWDATGVDLSPTAVDRARAAARERGVTATFEATDLAHWDHEGTFDLVTSSFLHSPVRLDRIAILRAAAGRVAPGGHLLVVSHAAAPPWSTHHLDMPSPAEELAELALPEAEWEVVRCDVVTRDATGPDGARAHLDDGVILARRRPSSRV